MTTIAPAGALKITTPSSSNFVGCCLAIDKPRANSCSANAWRSMSIVNWTSLPAFAGISSLTSRMLLNLSTVTTFVPGVPRSASS